MYMVGESHARISRGGRSYPGEKRFMQPSPKVNPINWREVATNAFGVILYFVSILLIIITLILGLG